jgi:hypothetical protein
LSGMMATRELDKVIVKALGQQDDENGVWTKQKKLIYKVAESWSLIAYNICIYDRTSGVRGLKDWIKLNQEKKQKTSPQLKPPRCKPAHNISLV